ncbi:uncharacterized protein LOC135931993 [Gordionus sp. m RMFG-2023]|uniref:uncharacterized protein LOC135931993 n=1 Tax=Gordionus sp. m RMFG-2023 TaxID=3053472 RepID=UPI0031FE0BB8
MIYGHYNDKNQEYQVSLLDADRLNHLPDNYELISKDIYALSDHEITDFDTLYIVDYQPSKAKEEDIINKSFIRDEKIIYTNESQMIPSSPAETNLTHNVNKEKPNHLATDSAKNDNDTMSQANESPIFDKEPENNFKHSRQTIPNKDKTKKKSAPKNKSTKGSNKSQKAIVAHPTFSSSDGEEILPNKEIDDSPNMDQVPAKTSPIKERKRELISKTYVNDKGYLVTEKVWESHVGTKESPDISKKDENILPPIENKNSTKHVISDKKKIATSSSKPSAKKQASMTDFFSRKK